VEGQLPVAGDGQIAVVDRLAFVVEAGSRRPRTGLEAHKDSTVVLALPRHAAEVLVEG
jgi:hypothetical protein